MKAITKIKYQKDTFVKKEEIENIMKNNKIKFKLIERYVYNNGSDGIVIELIIGGE